MQVKKRILLYNGIHNAEGIAREINLDWTVPSKKEKLNKKCH